MIGEKLENLLGKKFPIGVADGQAIYEVVKVGLKNCRVKWVEDNDINPDGYVAVIGEEGQLSTDVVLQKVSWEEQMDLHTRQSENWHNSHEIGSVVHYHNGFASYIRCEIVVGPKGHEEYEGVACCKPIALVGKWSDYDLKWDSYHVEKVRTGDLFRPHASNIWEYNPDNRSFHKDDPTKMEALVLAEKPIVLEATLKVVTDRIEINIPAKHDTETETTEISERANNLLNVLQEDEYEAEVHAEDGNIYDFNRKVSKCAMQITQ
jgi:hypothetical protein